MRGEDYKGAWETSRVMGMFTVLMVSVIGVCTCKTDKMYTVNM
jgi:hypothetical protein